MDGDARSKSIRLQGWAVALSIVGENTINQIFQLRFAGSSGLSPTGILFNLVQQKTREPILIGLRNGAKAVDCFFHQASHISGVYQASRPVCSTT